MNLSLILTEYNFNDTTIWILLAGAILLLIYFYIKKINISREISSKIDNEDPDIINILLVLVNISESLISASFAQDTIHGAFPARLTMHLTIAIANYVFSHKLITNFQDISELYRSKYVYNNKKELLGFEYKKYRSKYEYDEKTKKRVPALKEIVEHVKGTKTVWYLKEAVQIIVSFCVAFFVPIVVLAIIAKGTNDYNLLFFGTIEKSVPISPTAPSGVVLVYYTFLERLGKLNIITLGSVIVCGFHLCLTLYLPTIGLANRTEKAKESNYSFDFESDINDPDDSDDPDDPNDPNDPNATNNSSSNTSKGSLWGGFGGSSKGKSPF